MTNWDFIMAGLLWSTAISAALHWITRRPIPRPIGPHALRAFLIVLASSLLSGAIMAVSRTALITGANVSPWFGFYSCCLLALGPAIAVTTIFELIDDERRDRLGNCAACGYDLTGNVSGVCPECGRTVGEERHAREDDSV